MHPNYVQVVEELHDWYAIKLGLPTSATDTFAKKNRVNSMLRKLGTMMDQCGDLSHPSVVDALDLIWGARPNVRRAYLLRNLIRLGEFDVVAKDCGPIMIVPHEIIQYLHLPYLPANYQKHPKVRSSFDASQSTNMQSLWKPLVRE